jgi:hypothetical protein
MDQDHIPGTDLAQWPQCRQRGCPVQDHAERLRVAPAGWDGKHAGGRHHHVFGERAGTGADDVGADRERAVDLRADADDLAGGLDARDVRRGRPVPVGATALHDVREVDPGRTDSNQVLTRTRVRTATIGLEHQVLRSAVRPLDQCPHRVPGVVVLDIDLRAAGFAELHT